jgi:hypothetical protein
VSGLCTILTKDGGVRHFSAHQPLLVHPNMPLQLIINTNPQPDYKCSVRLRVCSRCGVTYLDGFEKTFAENVPDITQTPEDTH